MGSRYVVVDQGNKTWAVGWLYSDGRFDGVASFNSAEAARLAAKRINEESDDPDYQPRNLD